jgi:hypothetical protein
MKSITKDLEALRNRANSMTDSDVDNSIKQAEELFRELLETLQILRDSQEDRLSIKKQERSVM